MPRRTRERVAFVSSFGSLGRGRDEEVYRSLMTQQNLKWIDEQNQLTNLTFTLGETPFIALSLQEFSSLYLTLKTQKNLQAFNFDIKQEIKKYRKETDEFIERTFGFRI